MHNKLIEVNILESYKVKAIKKIKIINKKTEYLIK
jgi:hypothetical protein